MKLRKIKTETIILFVNQTKMADVVSLNQKKRIFMKKILYPNNTRKWYQLEFLK